MATWKWIWSWWSRQWADVRGNLKYGVLYWLVLGSGVTWLAHHLQAVFHANLVGWINLAAPIFSILAVAYLLVSTKGIRGRPNDVATVNASSSSIAKETSTVSPERRRTDLQGELIEIYIHRQNDTPISKIIVLLRAQVVNRGLEDTTVTRAGLHVTLSSFNELGQVVDILPTGESKNETQIRFSARISMNFLLNLS